MVSREERTRAVKKLKGKEGRERRGGKGREGKGREGKGREGKGREGQGAKMTPCPGRTTSWLRP
jgi:hypothetical protein